MSSRVQESGRTAGTTRWIDGRVAAGDILHQVISHPDWSLRPSEVLFDRRPTPSCASAWRRRDAILAAHPGAAPERPTVFR